MNRKSKFLIPALAAVCALTFVFATPYVLADQGFGGHFKIGPKAHGGPHAVTVDEFTGTENSIQIPEEIDKDTMKTLHDQVSVSLVDAVNAIPEGDETNYQNAGIGVIVNSEGEKFLAWILNGMTIDGETITHNTLVVDAGDVDNTYSVTSSFDLSTIEEMKSQLNQQRQNFSGDFEGFKGNGTNHQWMPHNPNFSGDFEGFRGNGTAPQWMPHNQNFSGDFEGMKEKFRETLGEQDNL